MNRSVTTVVGWGFVLGGSASVALAGARILSLVEVSGLDPNTSAVVGVTWVIVGHVWLWTVRQQEQMDNRMEAHQAWMAELEERGVDE